VGSECHGHRKGGMNTFSENGNDFVGRLNLDYKAVTLCSKLERPVGAEGRVVERLVLRERATGAHFVDVHCAYNVPRVRPRSEPCGLRDRSPVACVELCVVAYR